MGFVFISQVVNYITISIVIFLTMKDWITRTNNEKKIPNIFYPYMPLIALGFIIVRIMATNTTAVSFNIMVVVILTCSLAMFFRSVKNTKQKIVLGIVYSLLSGIIFLIATAGIFFSLFWITPVETDRISELSPNDLHIVEAIQQSEGALGGSTTVTIQRTVRFNLLLGELQYRPVQVHWGNWGDFFHIENIRWDGNNRFYIYRSVGETHAFELVGFRWRRVD